MHNQTTERITPDEIFPPPERTSATPTDSPLEAKAQRHARTYPAAHGAGRLRARGDGSRFPATASVPEPPARILVTADKGIVLADTENEPERLSEITQERFYAPDLNKIALEIRGNQQAGVDRPDDESRRLYVDKEGGILFGDEVGTNSGRLSEITQERFYARVASQTERDLVSAKLPDNARWASDGTYGGWVYSVSNEFEDTYELFLWQDPEDRTYKVSLISPDLTGQVGVHDCHLYSDGTLCLKRSGGPGYPSLETAYARAALWTRGASLYNRGYGFQFSEGS